MAALRLTITTQEQHPPKTPPPKKNALFEPGIFLVLARIREKNALKRVIILKEPPHYIAP